MPTLDLEAGSRQLLIRRLGPSFLCGEEVTLRHALFERRLIKADVVAVPTDPAFSDLALAFEVKLREQWEDPQWARAIRQASDYVYASVESNWAKPTITRRRVIAAFVFPAPPFVGSTGQFSEDVFLSGMSALAGHFRVGRAYISASRGKSSLHLCMGVNSVWTEGTGWDAHARGILAGKRQIGSSKVGILEELRNLEIDATT